jgi:RNA polymerase-interacting CarD/CdnL/TRCF family regulator
VSDANKGYVDSNGNTVTVSNNVAIDNTVQSAFEQLDRQTSPRHKDIKDFIKVTEDKIKESKEVTSILERALGYLKSFTFKEGDVVVSKTHGNGIVSGIGIGENGYHSRIDDEFPDQFYVVIATKKGYAKVSPEDIVPYTKASKVLYEQK